MGALDGLVAIITGSGKGVGRGEALALAKAGAKVVICSRTQGDIDETIKQVEAAGGTAIGVRCDVMDDAQQTHLVKQCVATFGRIDILVNNAHHMGAWLHPIEEWTAEEMDIQWQSGPRAAFLLMKKCFPYLKVRGGRVINTSAPSGHGVFTGLAGYSMVKEAIRSLTRCAAREWGVYGITVNNISPMAFSDASQRNSGGDGDLEAIYDMLRMPIRGMGDPEFDVGAAVVYLASPQARMVTGLTLGVDGGSAML